MIELFATSPLFAGGMIFLLGLCIGSFLNVVIYRVPVMLDHEWRIQASEILELPRPEFPRFNLILPHSRCPHCGHRITAIENIPVLSWLFLRGKCSACRAPISPRYPTVV